MAYTQATASRKVRSFNRTWWARMYEELYGDEPHEAAPADWYERIYADEAPAADRGPSFYDELYAGRGQAVVTPGPLDVARDGEVPAPRSKRRTAKTPAAKTPAAKRAPKRTRH